VAALNKKNLGDGTSSKPLKKKKTDWIKDFHVFCWFCWVHNFLLCAFSVAYWVGPDSWLRCWPLEVKTASFSVPQKLHPWRNGDPHLRAVSGGKWIWIWWEPPEEGCKKPVIWPHDASWYLICATTMNVQGCGIFRCYSHLNPGGELYIYCGIYHHSWPKLYYKITEDPQ
jgi:hypothetical protein